MLQGRLEFFDSRLEKKRMESNGKKERGEKYSPELNRCLQEIRPGGGAVETVDLVCRQVRLYDPV